jgi:hypothetical protein
MSKTQKLCLCQNESEKKPKDIEIYLNNKTTIQVNSLKYLGIIFDNKMTFREHINNMAEKV